MLLPNVSQACLSSLATVKIYPSDQYPLESITQMFVGHVSTLYLVAFSIENGDYAKDPFIKVRLLLVELGDAVVVSDQVANLTRHAILFLKRIDVDKYISQGFSQHSNLYMVSFSFNSQCSIGSNGIAYELRSKGYIRTH
ncbi:hypothetical protein HanPSC8_Chr11g0499891 [Helianthus annuus]|nr:hypothetical protein HanPSC8_Chr11g0499891 [Helianthus annuus]